MSSTSVKRAAFLNARPFLNSGRLKYMPFGLSLVKLLERAGYQVDLYLGEERNDLYQSEFSERVRPVFLDNKWVWERPGKLHYLLQGLHFQYLQWIKPHSYDLVIGCGQVGNVLASRLARAQSKPYVALSDEFPHIHTIPIWIEAERQALKAAGVIVVPDDCRFERLCQTVDGLEGLSWATLPNVPLMEEFEDLPKVDWRERLGLPPDSHLFLQAGGMLDFNQIAESMFSVPQWPENAILLVNGKESPYAPWSSYQHLDCAGRIFRNKELLDNRDFHSLLAQGTASFGLYRALDDLEWVGRSSGKIMRSLACGRPVIASDLFSLKWVEESGLGVLVSHPQEIPQAVGHLIENQNEYSQRCREVFRDELSFESYWPGFVNTCQQAGVDLQA